MEERKKEGKQAPDDAPEEDELLTVDEVATLLKINSQTVRNRIDAGDLPSVRLGRRVRVQRSVLEQLIGWQHGELAHPEVPRPHDPTTEPPLDLDAAAAALEQIGTGFVKLGAAIRTERPRGRRNRER
jgi:excisionase family DNA binding protein